MGTVSNAQFKNAKRVWEAFMQAVVISPFGGVGWTTTAAIARIGGMSKPTVQKYMFMAQQQGVVSAHVVSNKTIVWVWEK